MILGVIIAIIGFLIALIASTYNKLVRERNYVDESFSTMDVYLKKRYDLIPNLVETVKGYKNYEGSTLEAVIAARTKYMSATTPEEKIENENMISGALGKLFSLTESYPELKANESFMKLQGELIHIEDEILQARKYYNGTVRTFNTICETFPTVMVAGMLGFKKYTFFKVESYEERQNVKVSF